MKLHDALRELCGKFGNITVQNKKLVYQLSYLNAFDDCPAMREIMKKLISGGYGKELYNWSIHETKQDFLKHADGVKESLVRREHFDEGFAGYAVDSVSYAMGLIDHVAEPLVHSTNCNSGYVYLGEPPLLDITDNGESVYLVQRMKLEKCRSAAERGDVNAEMSLGVMYFTGHGVIQDYAEALKWFLKAAGHGDAEAQYQLGIMYFNGYGTVQDYAEALKWYSSAAAQGITDAMCNLGSMYDIGYGVQQNYTEAFKWYKKAADNGIPLAQNNIGQMYYFGQGIDQNYEESVEWFLKAAENGDIDAQDNLGVVYYFGHGVGQDKAAAVKWFRKAANQNNAEAKYHLGWMYAAGQGVEKNDAEALDRKSVV